MACYGQLLRGGTPWFWPECVCPWPHVSSGPVFVLWSYLVFVCFALFSETTTCIYFESSAHYQERPYHSDSTASRLLSEVKHCRARLVLRWGTTLESLVLFFCVFFSPFLLPHLLLPRGGHRSICICLLTFSFRTWAYMQQSTSLLGWKDVFVNPFGRLVESPPLASRLCFVAAVFTCFPALTHRPSIADVIFGLLIGALSLKGQIATDHA